MIKNIKMTKYKKHIAIKRGLKIETQFVKSLVDKSAGATSISFNSV